MGMPQTLGGVFGMMVFLAFLIGMIIPDTMSQDAQDVKVLQDSFRDRLNSTVNSNSTGSSEGFWGFVGKVTGLNGIYDFVLGFFQTVIAFIELIFAQFGIFINLSAQVPTTFYVFFALMLTSVFIVVIKLIFLSGD